jgi:hypothetical protein
VRWPRSLLIVPISLAAAVTACGDDESASVDSVSASDTTTAIAGAASTSGGFCEAMANLIVLLAPTESSSPAATRDTFTAATRWLAQADAAAPSAIADDVAGYRAAYDDFAEFLATVDFDLNQVFSTPEGRQLAIDTSHTLTPAIVEHTVDECGLSFGDEERPPPTTG